MAKGVNKVFLLGNTGKDTETRTTNGGTLAASVSLATADRVKDQQGNWSDRTEWHNLVAFGKLAEVFRDYVHKGSKINVIGKIQTRSWDDKNTGEKKYRTEIVVQDLTLLDSPQNGNGRQSGSQSGYGERETYADGGSDASEDGYGSMGISEQEIPF
jgi:single-strand DNA-binding protein